MFTGIIETLGEIQGMDHQGTNIYFKIKSDLTPKLKIDQSLSHNGVCLTVVDVEQEVYGVIAIKETLKKTTLGDLKIGDKVNLERCMPADGRFDGHIVQGHVDQVGLVTHIEENKGSWVFRVEFDPDHGNITVEKGSVSINGVSLTCFNSKEGSFEVAIIPYTYDHTNFNRLNKNDKVNLEFDILGKYIKRIIKGYA